MPLLLALLFGLTVLPTPLPVRAQGKDDFLSQALALAHALQRQTGVPSSVIIAQAILETGWGTHTVGDSNNYFGVKAFPQQDGTVNFGQIATGWVWAMTKEWDGNKYVDARERFRVYHTMADSFHDLGLIYTTNPRYAQAMQSTSDPREFARRVAAAGYATNPDYAARLIDLMDRQDLYQYDLAPDQAAFVEQSDYPVVNPGQEFEIYFLLRNVGSAEWSADGEHYLANTNGTTLAAEARQLLTAAVQPEEVSRWTIRMIAPVQAGRYRTAWRLYHDGEPFGPELYIDVTVRGQTFDLEQVAFGLLALAALLGAVSTALYVARRPRPAPPA